MGMALPSDAVSCSSGNNITTADFINKKYIAVYEHDSSLKLTRFTQLTLTKDDFLNIEYSVLFYSGENGSVTGDEGAYAAKGTPVSDITVPAATASDGYVFYCWDGFDSDIITGSVEATAVFVPENYVPDTTVASYYRSSSGSLRLRFDTSGSCVLSYAVALSGDTPAAGEFTRSMYVSPDNTVYTVTDLAAGRRYIHLASLNGDGTLNYLPAVMLPSNCCYSESFEGIAVDSYVSASPNVFAPVYQLNNGTGDANQKIIAASGTNTSRRLAYPAQAGGRAISSLTLIPTL